METVINMEGRGFLYGIIPNVDSYVCFGRIMSSGYIYLNLEIT